MKIVKLSLIALAILGAAHHAAADVTLAPLFQDNAVFQQGKPVPVWGTADAGEKITVEFAGQKKETTADATGHWKVALDALSASSQPAELTVTGKNTLKAANILVGEVWICSGQSNMEFMVQRAKDFAAEKTSANNPLIRHFKVEHTIANTPQDTVKSAWAVCTPDTVGDFTAVGYFFAREISKKLGVPVGLVNTTWGGTPIESFMSIDALKSNPAFAPVPERWKKLQADYPAQLKIYEERFAKWQENAAAAKAAGKTIRPPRKPSGGPDDHYTPSGVFNAMVYPLVPYAARGILWYQGEANAMRFTEYSTLFTTMIAQWRKDFGQGDLPFYFVQLANLERKVDKSSQQWAFQREAQATALTLPNTGMAVAADIGNPADIHPTNKQEVGRRLSLIAFALTYDKGGEYAGPTFQSATAGSGAMTVTLSHAAGLKLLDPAAPAFQLAGADKTFHPATAKIEGDKLIVTSPEVKEPVAVRYAWDNNPKLTLYNGTDLPAPPFRSDAWPAPASALMLPEASTSETP